MRVLHVVESLAPEAGSVAISLRGLFDALHQRGIESEVVTLGRPAEACGTVRTTPFQPSATARHLHGAALVHLHGWGAHLPRCVAGAARDAGTPYVISPLGAFCKSVHGEKTWRRALRGLLGENKLVRGAASITALNEAEHRALRAGGVNASVRVLPYGINIHEYEAADTADHDLPAPPQGRCLLLLGPLHPVEGLVPLIMALAEIATDADGWSIVLAGPETGSWRRMLEAAVRRKGGIERILFTSAPDVETQRAWLARASALAAPSLHVRCPVSIMQAVAAGVPVIASDHAAPDGLNGAIQSCAPRRENIREALRSIFRLSDQERTLLGQRARHIGRSLFDWAVLADRYAQFYRDLTQASSPT